MRGAGRYAWAYGVALRAGGIMQIVGLQGMLSLPQGTWGIGRALLSPRPAATGRAYVPFQHGGTVGYYPLTALSFASDGLVLLGVARGQAHMRIMGRMGMMTGMERRARMKKMARYGKTPHWRLLATGLLVAVAMAGAADMAQARPASGGGATTYGGNQYGGGYNGDSRLDNYGPGDTTSQYNAPEAGMGMGDGISPADRSGDGGGIQSQSTIPGGSSEGVPGMGSPDGGTFSNMNVGGVDSSATPGMN